MKRNIHVCHLFISLPRNNNEISGTYMIDLIESQNLIDGLVSGAVHVNPVKIGLTKKPPFIYFKGLLKKKQIERIRLKKTSPIFKAVNKRDSIEWRNKMIKVFDSYCKSYGKPDIVHAHSGRGAGEVALKLNEDFGIPFVVSEHNPKYISGDFTDDEIKRLNAVYRGASKILPVSKSMIPVIESIMSENRRDEIEVMPNALAKEFLVDSNIATKVSKGIVIVARLNENKSVDTALYALNKLIEMGYDGNLYIVGEGKKENDLKVLSAKLKIKDRVKILGFQEKKVISDLLPSMDALIICSKYEPFGLPVIEALSKGVPVVSTRCGGPEQISELLDGIYLVDFQDHENMAHKVIEAINDYPIMSKKREDLEKKALSVYGPNAIGNKWSNLYQDVLS